MIKDSGAKKIISAFKSAGYTAYAVGGCVRDTVMNRPVSDYDIAVPTPPDITEKVLEKNDIKFFETGIKHGTVTALVDNKPYELTTFRTDGSYTDNRRPDSVTFVSSIEDDLARRDFTVNAMAYNCDAGLIDLFDGLSDIRYRVIRTVGDADTRFNEDALRILRGIRFASVLGFEIEDNTSRSVLKNASLLNSIARERITAEMQKLLVGIRAGEMFCTFAKVFCIICPEFLKIYEKHASDYIKKSLDDLPANADLRLALLCVLATDGENGKKSEILARIFESFRLKNDTKFKIRICVLNFETEISKNRTSVKKILRKIGADNLTDLITLKSVLQNTDYSEVLKTAEDIVESGEAYTLSGLAVDGSDLKSMGIDGKEIGERLEEILTLVIEGKLPNDKQKITDYIKK